MPKTSPVEDRLRTCISNHPDWTVERIAASIVGSTRAMVRAMQAGEPVAPIIEEAKKAEVGTISLAQVRARYDIAAAIKRELAKLKPGALILEAEMRQRAAGRDANRFRRTVDNTEEFKVNRIKLQLDPDGGEAAWYWGDVSTISAAIKVRDSV